MAVAEPLVSVVMAVRNGARHLRESVASILAQDMPDFEFLIVDDASTDESPAILAAHAEADRRVRIVRLEGPEGQARALNAGLALARGRFVARHDDDDVALPWRLRVQAEFMARHPEYAVCGGMARLIDAAGHVGELARRPVGERRVARMLAEHGRNALIHSSLMLRAELGLQYRDRFLLAQDYDLLLRALSAGQRIINLPHVILHLRIEPRRQDARKQFRQILYRETAHRLFLERRATGSDSYDRHDFAPCDTQSLDSVQDPRLAGIAARLRLSEFASGGGTRREAVAAAARALRLGGSLRAAGVAALSLLPRPLLRSLRSAKAALTPASERPRTSIGVLASLGGGIATWRSTGTVGRELRLYEELVRRGLAVTLYTFDRPAEIRGLETPVRIVPGPPFRLPGRLCGAWALSLGPRWRHEGRGHACLITNQAHAGWPAIVLGRVWSSPVIARCGYVFSEQAATMGWTDGRSQRRAAWEAWTHRHAALSFIPTAALIAWCRNHMPGFDERRARCVPNVIDTDAFAPGPPADEPLDVLAVGRLHPEKRIGLLLHAVARVPGARLTLVGDGPERAVVEAEASRLGVPLALLRHVPNEMLPALYRRCRVFAIPSVREGNPKALLEAMACGAACVGTATPGIVNLITSGINGLLCDGSPESLASAIMRLLTDDDLRIRLGGAARAEVLARNSLPTILARYEDAIVALAAGEDPRAVSHTSCKAA
jgi:glycosyltransferase involved in cell wall biosynthesis/GT2 family glycosyltransferase